MHNSEICFALNEVFYPGGHDLSQNSEYLSKIWSGHDVVPGDGVFNTDLSKETAGILINASKSPESLVEVLAQHTVTVDSHMEAADNFIKRKLLKELP